MKRFRFVALFTALVLLLCSLPISSSAETISDMGCNTNKDPTLMFTVNLTGETFYYHTPEVFRYVEASMRFDYSGYSVASYSRLNEVIFITARHPSGYIADSTDAVVDIGAEHNYENYYLAETGVNSITVLYTFAPVYADITNPDVCLIHEWELEIATN